MSATTTPTDFSDLYVDLQNRTREQTGVTATENQAKRYINIALHDMHIGTAENFPWAERSDILLTQPKYTTGTVTISQGATTLEGASSPAWSTTNSFGVANVRAGGKIFFPGALDVYEVSSVTDADTLELTGKFAGTSLSADSYTYFEDEYSLASDFLRPIDQRQFSDSIPIELISEESGPLPEWDRVRAQSIDPQSAIQALDHVVVFSADVEATRAFYGDLLGIRLALDRTFEKRGVRLLFFRMGCC